ncbi:alpha/beta hydrolase [Dokdonella sp.]|uniref:alpha/beta fold hydrolase n=1 Tax=Dokdonella sp. TaxID=2291710 RepID=UPI0026122F10|nr:alpha/beta hydrolase [Dokdonella sp.]
MTPQSRSGTKRTPIAPALRALGHLALALLLAAPCGALVFLAVARLSSSPFVVFAATAAAMTVLPVVLVGRDFCGRRWVQARVLTAAASSLLVAAAFVYLARAGILDSGVQPAQETVGRDDEVAYWNLPTGSRIAYRHFGAAGGSTEPPVIYLHGGPGVPAGADAVRLLESLATAGRDVYAYDQAGVGASAPLPEMREYSLDRDVADLEAIRIALGRDGIDLVGTSWGSVLAAHYAAAFPGRVRRMVAISPGVLWERRRFRHDYSATAASVPPYSNERVMPPWRMIVAGVLARSNPELARRYAPERELSEAYAAMAVRFPSFVAQGHCRADAADVARYVRPRPGGNYYVNVFTLRSMESAADPRPALRRAGTSALILRGECDYVPAAAAKEYADSLLQARLVEVPGAGHSMLSSRPQYVAAATQAHLDDREIPLP